MKLIIFFLTILINFNVFAAEFADQEIPSRVHDNNHGKLTFGNLCDLSKLQIQQFLQDNIDEPVCYLDQEVPALSTNDKLSIRKDDLRSIAKLQMTNELSKLEDVNPINCDDQVIPSFTYRNSKNIIQKRELRAYCKINLLGISSQFN